MIIVSNTSPITNLAAIDKLSLLQQLYSNIIIPEADLLLLDERRGRQIAANFNIKFQGILGVLLAAKLRGLIPVIKPTVDELIGKAGFWVSQAVYTRVLQLANEI